MTMVERVSEAIHAELTRYVWGEGPSAYERRLARAAIAATRKPTQGMLEAAIKGRDGTLPAAVAEHVWTVMVEAALDEHTGSDGEAH